MRDGIPVVPLPQDIELKREKNREIFYTHFEEIKIISHVDFEHEDEIRKELDKFKDWGKKIFESLSFTRVEQSNYTNNIRKSDSYKQKRSNRAIRLIIKEEKKQTGQYEVLLNKEEVKINIPKENLKCLQNALITLLQLIRENEHGYCVPLGRIQDYPFAKYRGLMVDVARKKHKLVDLEKLIMLCVWYKINYLHIHFSDKQSYTLPSKAFPDLPTRWHHFTAEDIKMLNKLAKKHHITLVPEIDLPGHSKSIIDAYPEVFKVKSKKIGTNTINIGNEETYQAVAQLIEEICNLFPDSPIIHMGADEVKKEGLWEDPRVKKFMEDKDIPNPEELYKYFIIRMNEMVKKHGRKMAIWEGFRPGGEINIPKDILIYEFECTYNPPDNILKQGYHVVNTSWKPIYVTRRKHWPLKEIYKWNLYRWDNHADHSPATKNPFQFKPTGQVIGAQMCSWAQKRRKQIRSLKRRIAAFSEKIWNKSIATKEFGTLTPEEFEDFMKRLRSADQKLIRLMKHTFRVWWTETKNEKNIYNQK